MKADTIRASITVTKQQKVCALIISMLEDSWIDRTRILVQVLTWAGWTRADTGWWHP